MKRILLALMLLATIPASAQIRIPLHYQLVKVDDPTKEQKISNGTISMCQVAIGNSIGSDQHDEALSEGKEIAFPEKGEVKAYGDDIYAKEFYSFGKWHYVIYNYNNQTVFYLVSPTQSTDYILTRNWLLDQVKHNQRDSHFY